MSKRPRRRRRQQLDSSGWEALIWGTPGKKLVTAAAVLTAGLYVLGEFKPLLDSHLPSASQDELKGGLASVKSGLDQTLATATAAAQNAQQALHTSQTAQLDRLLQQRVQLEALINMNPNDTTLKLALEKTNIDISMLTAVTRQQPAATVSDPPPSVNAK